MNRAKIIIAGVAILSAVIIGLIAASMLEPEQVPVAAPVAQAPEIVQPVQSDVLVATRELKSGLSLTEVDMAWLAMPDSLIASTMIQKRMILRRFEQISAR